MAGNYRLYRRARLCSIVVVAAQETRSSRIVAWRLVDGVLARLFYRSDHCSADSYTMLALGPDRLAARSPEMLSAAGRDTMACRGTKTTFGGVARLGMGAVSKRLVPTEDFELVVVRHSAVIGL
jgi:hypothetical protein